MEGPYADPSKISATKHTIWLKCDLKHLCKYLARHLEYKSDCDVFQESVINGAVEYLNQRIIIGGLKKKDGVITKIRHVRRTYVPYTLLTCPSSFRCARPSPL